MKEVGYKKTEGKIWEEKYAQAKKEKKYKALECPNRAYLFYGGCQKQLDCENAKEGQDFWGSLHIQCDGLFYKCICCGKVFETKFDSIECYFTHNAKGEQNEEEQGKEK